MWELIWHFGHKNKWQLKPAMVLDLDRLLYWSSTKPSQLPSLPPYSIQCHTVDTSVRFIFLPNSARAKDVKYKNILKKSKSAQTLDGFEVYLAWNCAAKGCKNMATIWIKKCSSKISRFDKYWKFWSKTLTQLTDDLRLSSSYFPLWIVQFSAMTDCFLWVSHCTDHIWQQTTSFRK